MTRHDPNRLNAEDRILWNRVARTVTPLKDKVLEPAPEPVRLSLEEEVPPRPAGAAVGSPAARQKSIAEPKHLDKPTKDKLAKGRLQIGATVDLHGLTQAEAHSLLLSFLHRAHAAGLRYVLVITGKGSSAGGDGVLRRQVPVWLATAGFRELVSGFDRASRHHGGDGAIYVRLRSARAKA